MTECSLLCRSQRTRMLYVRADCVCAVPWLHGGRLYAGFETGLNPVQVGSIAYGTLSRCCGVQVVGDLAQFMVQNNLTEASIVDQADQLSIPNR